MTSILPGLILAAVIVALFKLRARNKRRFDAMTPEQRKAERRRRFKADLWD
jgi:hypothetical protein